MRGISRRSPVRKTTHRSGTIAFFGKVVAAASIAIALLAISAAPGTAQTIGGGKECAPIIERTIIIWEDGEVWIIDEVIGETCVEVVDEPSPCDEDEGDGYAGGSLCLASSADGSGPGSSATLQAASMGGLSGHPVGWALSVLMGLAAIGAAAFKARAPWARRGT